MTAEEYFNNSGWVTSSFIDMESNRVSTNMPEVLAFAKAYAEHENETLQNKVEELEDENIYMISRIRSNTKHLTNQQIKDIWGERLFEIINKH